MKLTSAKFTGWLWRNWLIVALVLLLLWLLPKLLNVYALILARFRELIDAGARAGRLPVELVNAVGSLVDKVGNALPEKPWITWIVPLALARPFPKLSIFLTVWSALDLFKPQETLTANRRHDVPTKEEFLPPRGVAPFSP